MIWENNLILNNLYKNFSDNLIEDKNNLFVNLIDWNIEKFFDFDYEHFEEDFEGEVEYNNKKLI